MHFTKTIRVHWKDRDIEFEAGLYVEVSGRYRPATWEEPEEYPEVESYLDDLSIYLKNGKLLSIDIEKLPKQIQDEIQETIHSYNVDDYDFGEPPCDPEDDYYDDRDWQKGQDAWERSQGF